MLSYCCFCSGKFQFPRTEHLSSPPLLHCLLNPFVCFPVFVCAFCFILLLLQISPIITEVENISGDPRLFPSTVLPKYLTGDISHYCIVGGNHGTDVHIVISQSSEWCESACASFTTLAFQSSSLMFGPLMFGLRFPGVAVEVVDLTVIMSRCWCIDLYDGDIERSCSQGD